MDEEGPGMMSGYIHTRGFGHGCQGRVTSICVVEAIRW